MSGVDGGKKEISEVIRNYKEQYSWMQLDVDCLSEAKSCYLHDDRLEVLINAGLAWKYNDCDCVVSRETQAHTERAE